MKTIQVSDEVHKILTNMCSKKNNLIMILFFSLIKKKIGIWKNLPMKKAEYYDECIEKLEKGDYSDIYN